MFSERVEDEEIAELLRAGKRPSSRPPPPAAPAPALREEVHFEREELISYNEELQSLNEELESSNQELVE
jgi:hypothetical protein